MQKQSDDPEPRFVLVFSLYDMFELLAEVEFGLFSLWYVWIISWSRIWSILFIICLNY